MNTVVKSVPVPKAIGATRSGSSAADDLRGRESQELVFALSGPVGSGIQFVNQTLTRALQDRGYEVVPIKVSKLFDEEANRHGISGEKPLGPPEFQRIWALQDVGNELRAND